MIANRQMVACFLIIAGLAVSGCSKFLDHPVENQAAETTINYADLTLMYQPVSGAYHAVTVGGYITWIPTFMLASQSDDIYPLTGYSEVNNLIHNGVSGSSIQSFWAINQGWVNDYSAIITCNSALAELSKFGKNIPASDATNQQLLLRYQAETRFLVALGHYYLCRSYGDVPILGP